MHNDGNGEKLLAVPAALVEQLQNMANKGGNCMQYGPGPTPPGPAPRPVSEDQSRRTDD